MIFFIPRHPIVWWDGFEGAEGCRMIRNPLKNEFSGDHMNHPSVMVQQCGYQPGCESKACQVWGGEGFLARFSAAGGADGRAAPFKKVSVAAAAALAQGSTGGSGEALGAGMAGGKLPNYWEFVGLGRMHGDASGNGRFGPKPGDWRFGAEILPVVFLRQAGESWPGAAGSDRGLFLPRQASFSMAVAPAARLVAPWRGGGVAPLGRRGRESKARKPKTGGKESLTPRIKMVPVGDFNLQSPVPFGHLCFNGFASHRGCGEQGP